MEQNYYYKNEYSYTIPFVLHKNCLIENDSDLVSGLSSANSVKEE